MLTQPATTATHPHAIISNVTDLPNRWHRFFSTVDLASEEDTADDLSRKQYGLRQSGLPPRRLSGAPAGIAAVPPVAGSGADGSAAPVVPPPVERRHPADRRVVSEPEAPREAAPGGAVVDIVKPRRETDREPWREARQRVGERMRSGPAHVGEYPGQGARMPRADEPKAAIRRRAEHDIAAAEQPKSFHNVRRGECGNIGADQHRRARRAGRQGALHASAEV